MRLHLIAFTGLLWLGLAVDVRADIVTEIFSHAPILSGQIGAPSQPDQGSYETATLFTTTKSLWPGQVSWYGTYFGPRQWVLPGTDFTIRFMQDNGGMPGAVAAEYAVSPTPLVLVPPASAVPIESYSADLSAIQKILLPAGSYWLSILETDTRTTTPWRWQFSTDSGNDVQRLGESGTWDYNYLGSTVAYTLEMTVPEPSSCIAWGGLGVIGSATVWRTRRKRTA